MHQNSPGSDGKCYNIRQGVREMHQYSPGSSGNASKLVLPPYLGCQRVTDTDGRTDVKPIAITCFSIADARKKRTM